MKKFADFSKQELIDYITDKHWVEHLSLREIAKEIGSSSTTLWRFCSQNQIPLMTKEESLKYRIERKGHPRKGKKLTQEHKDKIGKSQCLNWKTFDDEKRELIRQKHRDNFNKREDKDEFVYKGAQAIRKAADEGSKLEKFIMQFLDEQGIQYEHHYKGIFGNTNLEADFFLPAHSVVLEVDGPSHFRNNFSEDTYTKQVEYDNKKDAIVLSYGGSVIRIQHMRNVSRIKCVNICRKILIALDLIDNEVIIINGDNI